MYYLGVDGGGTKTSFLLLNEDGRAAGSATLGTLDWFQIGPDGIRNTLAEGIGQVCVQAGIDPSQLAYAVLGIPCLGDELIDEVPIVEEFVRDVLGSTPFRAVNDAEVGWAGSLACRPGIHLVAGTGAIGYGVDQDGRAARASGWGHMIGDEGSAYWLGRQLIAAFTREADGREERSMLYEVVREHCRIADDFELLRVVQQEWSWSREQIAGLAKLVYQAAQGGESKAIKLYEQAAYELSLIVHAIYRKLWSGETAGTRTPISVSYSGGVFRAGSFILEPLKRYLPEDTYTLVTPQIEPVAGAALYAYKELHRDADLAALAERLKQ
jgi:N-acetylglucosamine kinase-like BadF-type ATPase